MDDIVKTDDMTEEVLKEVKEFHNKEMGDLKSFCPRCTKDAILLTQEKMQKEFDKKARLGKEKFGELYTGEEVMSIRAETLAKVNEAIDKLQKNVSKQRNEQSIGWHNGLEELKASLGEELSK